MTSHALGALQLAAMTGGLVDKTWRCAHTLRDDRRVALWTAPGLTPASLVDVAPAELPADRAIRVESRSGTLEYFLTERYCLFSCDSAGRLVRANIHHVPWPLEEAEAEIERNDLAEAIGIELPDQEPVLHYSRRLAVYVWPAEQVRRILATGRTPVVVAPSG